MKFDPKYLQGNEKNAVAFRMEQMPFMPGVGCHPNGGVGSLRVSLSGRFSTTGLNRMKKKQMTLYWSSRKKFDTTSFLENLKEYQYSIPYTVSVKPYLQYKREKSLAGVLQIAFERVGHIGYVDAFESNNAEHNPGQSRVLVFH